MAYRNGTPDTVPAALARLATSALAATAGDQDAAVRDIWRQFAADPLKYDSLVEAMLEDVLYRAVRQVAHAPLYAEDA